MSDQIISKAISSVQNMTEVAAEQLASSVTSPVVSRTPSENKKTADTTASKTESADESKNHSVKTENEDPQSVVGGQNSKDVYLRFKVDEKTQDITIYILDRTTREVVRTIPSEELAKLKAGDLVSLFI